MTLCCVESTEKANILSSAPLTHLVLGLDVGALLHQVPDSVLVANHSCIMERRVSKLRTSQSGWWHLQATLRTPKTHPVPGLDVGALIDEFTQLRHVASAGGSDKLLVHFFLCYVPSNPFPTKHSCSAQASAQGPGVSPPPHSRPLRRALQRKFPTTKTKRGACGTSRSASPFPLRETRHECMLRQCGRAALRSLSARNIPWSVHLSRQVSSSASAASMAAADGVPVLSDDSRIENDVGITTFTNSAPGFSAVLKHRHVHDCSGLTCDTRPPLPHTLHVIFS